MTTPELSDAEVYAQCAKDLVRFATGLVGPSDAADVVSAAVVRCLSSRAWPGVRDRRGYLFRAVLNEARTGRLSTWRRENRERRVSPREVVSLAEIDPGVLAAVADILSRQRAVVILTYWADQDPAAIAELLDVSEGTVRSLTWPGPVLDCGRCSMPDLDDRIRAVVNDLVDASPDPPVFESLAAHASRPPDPSTRWRLPALVGAVVLVVVVVAVGVARQVEVGSRAPETLAQTPGERGPEPASSSPSGPTGTARPRGSASPPACRRTSTRCGWWPSGAR